MAARSNFDFDDENAALIIPILRRSHILFYEAWLSAARHNAMGFTIRRTLEYKMPDCLCEALFSEDTWSSRSNFLLPHDNISDRAGILLPSLAACPGRPSAISPV